MKVELNLVIGKRTYKIIEEVNSSAEFFQKMAFYSNLPETGPNGETDLVLTYKTPQGYEYYSIVSKQAGQEYKFGIKQSGDGVLFPKGWEKLYEGDGTSTEVSQTVSANGGLGQAAPTPTPVPVQNVAAAPAAVQQAPIQNAQVQKQADNILSKFGIN